MHTVPNAKADPELGDVYKASPRTSVNGDVHGQNKRPIGVVKLERRVVRTITRTTQVPAKTDHSIFSAKNPTIGLNKDGYWAGINTRPVMRHHFADSSMCEYLGKLPSLEKESLLQLWNTLDMLGLQNR